MKAARTCYRHIAGEWGVVLIVTVALLYALAAARTELGLPAGAPVPLVVGVGFPETAFSSGLHDEPVAAIKTVWLGEAADNPTLVTDPPEMAELVVPMLTDVPLSVDSALEDDVNWLTSAGTMHDFDLPQSYLRVELEDPTTGDLAVVVRTELGGVAHEAPVAHEDDLPAAGVGPACGDELRAGGERT